MRHWDSGKPFPTGWRKSSRGRRGGEHQKWTARKSGGEGGAFGVNILLRSRRAMGGRRTDGRERLFCRGSDSGIGVQRVTDRAGRFLRPELAAATPACVM